MFAILISLGALAFIIAIARHYRGQGVQKIKLPSGLTLDGLIALLSTLARAALMVPVASVLSQEAWLLLSDTKRKKIGHSQLRDLELSMQPLEGHGEVCFCYDISGEGDQG